MRKIISLLLLAALLPGILFGCGKPEPAPDPGPAQTEPAAISATVPPDGDPGDVTCKGSYTGSDPEAVVAAVEDCQLTNAQLNVWYWLEAAAWQQAGRDTAPDFSLPLDTQPCPIDSSVNSWQQFFLKRALNAWHCACALELQSRVQELPTEEAYQPNLDNHEIYMTGMPATEYLYGYKPLFQPNSMHEAYLDSLPQTLDALAQEKGFDSLADMAQSAFGTDAETVEDVVRLYNYSYMYFTTLSYDLEHSQQDVQEQINAGDYLTSGTVVDIRHILLIPGVEGAEETFAQATVAEDGTVTCSEAAWDACKTEAQALLEYWQKKTKHNESAFAELANKNSEDPGTALNGGAYYGIRQGQLTKILDDWCFDPARQPGDTEILRSDYGCHILYFCGSEDAAWAEAEADLVAQQHAELIRFARKRYPAETDYSAIALAEGAAVVSASDVLYPDIAHERFPEVPLYLQQDYPSTMYGGFKITTNGCGITSMAMLASYMADDALTPPEMCARFGTYSHRNGTDGMIFYYEPPGMGFFLRETTYDPTVAKAALEEGQIVISVQHKGYWTRGGHYIVLEKINEDGLIQVRDSNIYNYSRIPAHVDDCHTWGSITSAGSGFWIFEDKITRIPACSRCGTPEGVVTSLLQEDYLCEKCTPALVRRGTYLNACSE